MIYASTFLLDSGFDAICLNYITETNYNKYVKEIDNSDVIVLPMPLSRDKINVCGTVTQTGEFKITDLYSRINEKSLILTSSKPSESIFESTKFINYSNSESYIQENAYITAEGALGHILQNSPKTLISSKILLLGWGRIAKHLYNLIASIGVKPAIVLRNIDLLSKLKENAIEAYSFEELDNIIDSFDVIVNTVPSQVISEKSLIKTKPDVYISELASEPGGYNHALALELEKSSYVLRGLPGICATESAGIALGKCVLSYLKTEV